MSSDNTKVCPCGPNGKGQMIVCEEHCHCGHGSALAEPAAGEVEHTGVEGGIDGLVDTLQTYAEDFVDERNIEVWTRATFKAELARARRAAEKEGYERGIAEQHKRWLNLMGWDEPCGVCMGHASSLAHEVLFPPVPEDATLQPPQTGGNDE